MDPRGDSRYNLNYSMSSIGLSLADQADMYGNPAAVAALGTRPPSGGLIQSMGGMGTTRSGSLMQPNVSASQCQSLSNSNTNSAGGQRGIKRTASDCYEDHHGMPGQSLQGLESCTAATQQQQQQQQQQGSNEVVDESYIGLQNKKSPPANGKKTKGRVKIKMEYIDNKLRRYTTFSKRKTGIMKKAYELSTLTGTQVMLLVASETGHVYTFATRKLQPMITSEAGKQLIQTCLNSPDPPSVGGGDQRMSATGFEETELSYNIADEDSKDDPSAISSGNESDESSDVESPGPSMMMTSKLQLDATSNNNNPNSADRLQLEETTQKQQQQQQSQPSVLVKTSTYQSSHLTQAKLTNAPTNAAAATASAATSSNNNLVYPTTSLSNIPQEVILQLIQSGHLQLHTEEDGSGSQYVAIPLSSSTNLIKSNPNAASSSTTAVKQPKELLDNHSKDARNQVGDSNGVIIKQELE